jgi:cytochrome c-type biogenesis protein CcmH
MTAFILAASALALLSLAFVLQPLWRGRRAAGLALTLSLAVVTGLLYTLVGTPRALDATQREQPTTLEGAIAQLRARLEADPSQLEGWLLLGRALTTQGEVIQARDAYAKAAALAPQEPDVLTQAAEARARANDRQFDATAVALLRQALAQQPMHQRARWFLGIAQRQAKQPAEAAKTWAPLLAIVDSKTAEGLREQINMARAEAGLEALPATVAAEPAGGTGSVAVRVSLDSSLQLPPGATLFVMARQAGGPPMPVAAEKIVNPTFPLEVVLDDADSPMPTLKLSALLGSGVKTSKKGREKSQVELLARVSTSGDATPQPGDLESQPQPVFLPFDGPVELRIDHARD